VCVQPDSVVQQLLELTKPYLKGFEAPFSTSLVLNLRVKYSSTIRDGYYNITEAERKALQRLHRGQWGAAFLFAVYTFFLLLLYTYLLGFLNRDLSPNLAP